MIGVVSEWYRSGIGADRRVSELIGVVSELIGVYRSDRRVSELIGEYRSWSECIRADRSVSELIGVYRSGIGVDRRVIGVIGVDRSDRESYKVPREEPFIGQLCFRIFVS